MSEGKRAAPGITRRLLDSFAAVELQPQHLNNGDETPALRDFGFAPVVASALIRWGEQHQLVATFENAQGRSNGAFSWQPRFLRAACEMHLLRHGLEGEADLPERFLMVHRPSWYRIGEAGQKPPACTDSELISLSVSEVDAYERIHRAIGPLLEDLRLAHDLQAARSRQGERP